MGWKAHCPLLLRKRVNPLPAYGRLNRPTTLIAPFSFFFKKSFPCLRWHARFFFLPRRVVSGSCTFLRSKLSFFPQGYVWRSLRTVHFRRTVAGFLFDQLGSDWAPFFFHCKHLMRPTAFSSAGESLSSLFFADGRVAAPPHPVLLPSSFEILVKFLPTLSDRFGGVDFPFGCVRDATDC